MVRTRSPDVWSLHIVFDGVLLLFYDLLKGLDLGVLP